MKRKIKIIFACMCLSFGLYAQVSVGTVELPADGALLQLKTIDGAAPGEKNAEKGLLLSRVSLVDYMKLDPAVPNASDEEKKEHIGLVVYNLTVNEQLSKGIAVWTGTQWNCITNKEINKNIGMEVKKNLYSAHKAHPANSVSFHSVEVSMWPEPSYNTSYYGFPQFRLTDAYKPTTGTRTYEYHITQYWSDGGVSGYSNDIIKQEFTSTSGYRDFINSSLSPEERNEVWMYDEESDEIFHIQFFIMGEKTLSEQKTYAILIEQF